MSYSSGTPRRRGGGSGGSNYTATPGRGSSGLHAGGSLTYEVPPTISRPPLNPDEEPVPRLDGPPPRALGFSPAATTPMRGRTSATPSVRSSSSSSAASQHSRPGSAAGTGRPGGNPSPPRQDAYLAQFGGAGLPPAPPPGMIESGHARAAARQAELARTPNLFRPGDLPPAPPPGMGGPMPPAGHPPAGSQPGASGQTPKRPGRHSPPAPSGRGGKK